MKKIIDESNFWRKYLFDQNDFIFFCFRRKSFSTKGIFDEKFRCQIHSAKQGWETFLWRRLVVLILHSLETSFWHLCVLLPICVRWLTFGRLLMLIMPNHRIFVEIDEHSHWNNFVWLVSIAKKSVKNVYLLFPHYLSHHGETTEKN